MYDSESDRICATYRPWFFQLGLVYFKKGGQFVKAVETGLVPTLSISRLLWYWTHRYHNGYNPAAIKLRYGLAYDIVPRHEPDVLGDTLRTATFEYVFMPAFGNTVHHIPNLRRVRARGSEHWLAKQPDGEWRIVHENQFSLWAQLGQEALRLREAEERRSHGISRRVVIVMEVINPDKNLPDRVPARVPDRATDQVPERVFSVWRVDEKKDEGSGDGESLPSFSDDESAAPDTLQSRVFPTGDRHVDENGFEDGGSLQALSDEEQADGAHPAVFPHVDEDGFEDGGSLQALSDEEQTDGVRPAVFSAGLVDEDGFEDGGSLPALSDDELEGDFGSAEPFRHASYIRVRGSAPPGFTSRRADQRRITPTLMPPEPPLPRHAAHIRVRGSAPPGFTSRRADQRRITPTLMPPEPPLPRHAAYIRVRGSAPPSLPSSLQRTRRRIVPILEPDAFSPSPVEENAEKSVDELRKAKRSAPTLANAGDQKRVRFA